MSEVATDRWGVRVMRRAIARAAAVSIVLASTGLAGQWTPSVQPDLAKEVSAAQALKVEELPPPIRSTRRGRLLYAPNPDRKSYDLLQIYFKKYRGPNTIVVIDVGSGEVKQLLIPHLPLAAQFHQCPSVVAPNGKLYISITAGRYGRQKICI